jgi:hypothetical protein
MLPDDNPKTANGVQKPSFACIPPVALLHLAHAMMNGANKYGRMNWRDHTVTSTIYYDAMMRHVLSWADGETYDRHSGLHHLAHVMACCSILLDAEAQASLNDDRPWSKGVAADLCQQTSEVIRE